ncbi:MAG TPA: hypothetical protein VFL16_06070 [Steroidobacteraceae bacterium]|nr:hypothetical protein [Steroidobacteraceae bacterium]
MLLRLLVVTSFAATLSACGGSSDSGNSEPVETSGVFLAGGAQGVHYSTPTRSGSTDADGTFKYLPGETVSFSIGSIQLGSAPGAPSITVFTLAGGAPPATELALRRELDRARRVVTPFVRAVNIQWLMMALDADHDPANGLDLRNAEALLAGATLDLGQRLIPFGSRLMSLAPGLTLGVPPWKAVAEAYRGSGITVAVHARTAYRSTEAGFSEVTNHSTSYGAGGVREASVTDLGDDGSPESTISWTYDSLGRLKSQSVRTDPASLYATNSDITWQFDARGARTAYEATTDERSDGTVDSVMRISYENDSYGFPTATIVQQYAGDGATLAARSEEHIMLDAQRHQTSLTYDSDTNGDGVYDSRWTESRAVDSSGRYTGSVREEDLDGDGTVDARSVTTIDYSDPSGTVVTESERDDNADGVVDSRFKHSARYDSDGFLLWQEYQSDDDADGTPEYLARDELSYDPEHRVITLENPRDDNGDGVIDSSSRNTYTYDPVGNRLTSQFALYNASSPDAVYQINEQRTYGASGELLKSQSTIPGNGAGSPASGGSSVATQTPVADGVLLLAQDYLESSDIAYVSSR